MLCSRPWLVTGLAVLLVFAWALRVFDIEDVSFLGGIATPGPSIVPTTPIPAADTTTTNIHDQEFLRLATAIEFPHPFSPKPIQAICASSSPQPGLLFSCEEQHGGISMVRNQVLRCVRYALAAGATGLVVPSMQLRDEKDITRIETAVEVPLENMLDREAFVSRLREGCGRLRIYNKKEDFPVPVSGWDSRRVVDIVGTQFDLGFHETGLRKSGAAWRVEFEAWLRDNKTLTPSLDEPVHVRVQQSFMEYPVASDGIAFAYEFGKILSFRKDTRALAAKVLLRLREKFGLAIDAEKALTPGQYYGAHLRLEEDAIKAWNSDDGWLFSNEEAQFGEHLRNMERFPELKVVYVACGDRRVVERFAKRIEQSEGESRVVVAKEDLLEGEDLEALEALTFDQRGLVDFLMMFKASQFMGVAHSSFPWTVALRRHEMSRYTGLQNNESDILRDEFSVIMGRVKDYLYIDPFAHGLWP